MKIIDPKKNYLLDGRVRSCDHVRLHDAKIYALGPLNAFCKECYYAECPDHDVLMAVMRGVESEKSELSPAEQEGWEKHIDSCDTCSDYVELCPNFDPLTEEEKEPEPVNEHYFKLTMRRVAEKNGEALKDWMLDGELDNLLVSWRVVSNALNQHIQSACNSAGGMSEEVMAKAATDTVDMLESLHELEEQIRAYIGDEKLTTHRIGYWAPKDVPMIPWGNVETH